MEIEKYGLETFLSSFCLQAFSVNMSPPTLDGKSTEQKTITMKAAKHGGFAS